MYAKNTVGLGQWKGTSGIYCPADVYNAEAYPGAVPYSDQNHIALIRPASMLLRDALEQPAAKDIIQTSPEEDYRRCGDRRGSHWK